MVFVFNLPNAAKIKIQDTSVLVGPKKERLDIKAALSNSFGFGGHNSSIIFAPFKWNRASPRCVDL